MSEAVGKTNEGAFMVSRNIPLKAVDGSKLQDAISSLVSRDLIVGARLVERNRLHVSYDASCVGIHDIETWLDESNIERDSGLGWRMKSAWYAFLDENAKSNAMSSGGACCNRPPPGSGDAGKVR